MGLAELNRLDRRLRSRLQSRDADKRDYRSYAGEPVAYAKEVLQFEFIPDKIEEGMRKIHESPFRVAFQSSHKYGKSETLGLLTNYFYDSYDPSVTLVNGPSFDSVNDIVWGAVRRQRLRAGLPGLMPKSPVMTDGPGHVAKGMTTNTGERFHGRHSTHNFVIFDEAVSIDKVFWNVARTMAKPEPGNAWVVAFNPTDITSACYEEIHSCDKNGNPNWTVIELDSITHPNILAELRGEKPPIPDAVSLAMFDDWLYSYGCDRITADKATAEDLQWPPGSGVWYHQSAEFLARCRGIWPEQSAWALWTEALWNSACERDIEPPIGLLPQIGVDVARSGPDYTAFHVRAASTSLEHSGRNNGWSLDKTADYAKGLAIKWAAIMTADWEKRQSGRDPIDPKRIAIKVDDDGVGGGVTDILRRDGWNVSAITARTAARGRYPSRRSELWFTTRDMARDGRLALKRIPSVDLARMKQQFIACEWAMQGDLRVVMPKEFLQEKIGRSPDDADAVNLAYAEPTSWTHAEQPKIERKPTRGVFG